MTMRSYMRGMSAGGAVSSQEGLTEEQLRRATPSIFAAEAHESRSARFAPIPTIDVVRSLEVEGFVPFFAQQSRTRDDSRRNFTKHMLRLRHRSITNDAGEAFEVILVNANDGSSSYQMLPGFFRFVCSNGLFVGETFEQIKVRHSGKSVTDDVIEGAYTVLGEYDRAKDTVQRMKAAPCLPHHRTQLALKAHRLRWPDEKKAPVDACTFHQTRRMSDRESTLWAAFNVVQENIIRGGFSYWRHSEDGKRVRKGRVREVTGVDQVRRINRGLWDQAEKLLAA